MTEHHFCSRAYLKWQARYSFYILILLYLIFIASVLFTRCQVRGKNKTEKKYSIKQIIYLYFCGYCNKLGEMVKRNKLVQNFS